MTVRIKNWYAARCRALNSPCEPHPTKLMLAQKARCEQDRRGSQGCSSRCFSHFQWWCFQARVTEGAGATDWRKGEARGVPSVSSSPSRRIWRSQGGGGSVLQLQLCRAAHGIHHCAAMALGMPNWGQRLVCEKPLRLTQNTVSKF